MTMKKKYLFGLSRIIIVLLSVMLITGCHKKSKVDEGKKSDKDTEYSENKDTKSTSDSGENNDKKEDGGETIRDDDQKGDNEAGDKKDDVNGKADSDSEKENPEITEVPVITEAPDISAESAKKALTGKLEERYADFKSRKANEWIEFSNDVYANKLDNSSMMLRLKSKYNWNNYDRIMQFVYSFVDLDNDGINELITCELTRIGTDYDDSRLTIYKWHNNDVIIMLDDPNCLGFGIDSLDNSWYYPFVFSNDYSYLCMDYDEECKIYKLNGDKYECFAVIIAGLDYAAFYENGVERHDSFQLFYDYEDKIRNNPAQLNMSVYEYMANPLTKEKQATLFKPLSNRILEEAREDGHISDNPKNYIVDDLDDDGVDEVIINDNYELMIYDTYGDAIHYKYKDIYVSPDSIAEEYLEYNLAIEYYSDEKMVHCKSNYSYLGIPGTEFGSNDYYCSMNKYNELTEWEIYTYEDIDFSTEGGYERLGDISIYKKNGVEVSEREFKEAQPKGRHIEILPGNVVNKSDFIFYDSNRRELKEDELTCLTDEELRIARNELYARYGYIFSTPDMKKYFDSKQWYKDVKNRISADDFVEEAIFNEVELANWKLIRKIESDRKK